VIVCWLGLLVAGRFQRRNASRSGLSFDSSRSRDSTRAYESAKQIEAT
jgi:hypothetical protein